MWCLCAVVKCMYAVEFTPSIKKEASTNQSIQQYACVCVFVCMFFFFNTFLQQCSACLHASTITTECVCVFFHTVFVVVIIVLVLALVRLRFSLLCCRVSRTVPFRCRAASPPNRRSACAGSARFARFDPRVDAPIVFHTQESLAYVLSRPSR